MPIAGDRRSADAVITIAADEALVEVETRVVDVQALERKIRAKSRDLGIERVILLVADTRHNRHVLKLHPELWRAFPLTTRACLKALSEGRLPGADALVIL